MNKRLFVVAGAMLCAVVAYASVLAVKNRAARNNVAPNTAHQPGKPSKNPEVMKVSTDANSATATMQNVVGPTNPNVPEHVVYSFLFRHQNFMTKKAQDAESRGKDSSFFRNYYQREAKLDDTAEYLAHRLDRVGAEASLFSSDAIAMLHEASSGRLREIDRIATDALKRGARRKLKKIDRQLIELAVAAEPID